MREFKFRAWDIFDKKMYHQIRVGGYFYGEPTNPSVYHCGEWMEMARCEVMQYTGLKDINGKEIYEGDIVIYHDSYNETSSCGVVDFEDASFRISNKCLIGYRWQDYEVKVIGNVYEHDWIVKALDENWIKR